jgi:hypothetical protein
LLASYFAFRCASDRPWSVAALVVSVIENLAFGAAIVYFAWG